MSESHRNVVVVLGPTASGKTALGVRLAREFGGEIVSCDSRQVYRGLDIGSGKDLEEYAKGGEQVAYHLVDVADLDEEYSVFRYQRGCFDVLEDLFGRGRLPVLVGGTGLYLEAALNRYAMTEAPESPALRTALSTWSMEELEKRLRDSKGPLHNTTDVLDRNRLIRAIEIAESPKTEGPLPLAFDAVVLGIRWPRTELHARIRQRLRERMQSGLIEEVEGLVAQGVPRERLIGLGLEYRFVMEYLDETIKNRNDLFQKLASAICAFAKRQETWFRRMERNGLTIHWLDGPDFGQARHVVAREVTPRGSRPA